MADQPHKPLTTAERHDQMEDIPSNTSSNRPFREVLQAHLSRRKVMVGGLGVAATSFLAPAAFASNKSGGSANSNTVRFDPVKISDVVDTTMPTISTDYEYQVLIPWGTPIEPGVVKEYTGDPMTRPTSKEAALQVGLGHDGMWFFEEERSRRNSKGMLCINHEFGTNEHALGKEEPESLEDVRLSQNVHGVSCVSIVRKVRNGATEWIVEASPNARRITVNTPVDFSGPAAESELLQNPNGNIALGTVNNCGSGPTLWNTYLTCEENFNGYFGASMGLMPTEEQERYGFSDDGFGYGWYRFDRRFDLSDPDYENEQHRFGWVVEIDPHDGTQKPVKRTALGRFKHEAIAMVEGSGGRVACYMGDDQRFDYCYKYVSNESWRKTISAGNSPLDDGKLYVARFDEDGTGEWLELTIDNPVLANRFNSQAEVMIFARVAADLLGATPMDRPEWTTVGKNGDVYWTLTNNSDRTEPNAANPEAPNSDGHIIRTVDSDHHVGTTFEWEIYILASSTQGTEGVFTDPDAAYIDPDNRLFIGTDGGQPDGLQDQLVVFDTNKAEPEPRRLLVGVNSDEVTGFTLTPNRRTGFVNLQHPGNGDPSSTNFPAPFDGVTVPRDCTLVITRKNGGRIGS
ncbi:MAG: PhoX family phosphatase [Pseudomonadota bacterium]